MDLNVAIITVGSMTYAIKARKALSHEGIKSKLVKLEKNKDGCSYGIELKEERLYSAVVVLRTNGIEYKLLRGGNNGIL